MKKYFNKFFKFLESLIPDKSDVLLFTGLGFLSWGIYQIHRPSSFIIGGILLMCLGYLQVIPQSSKKVN